jgi:hypothetical protein
MTPLGFADPAPLSLATEAFTQTAAPYSNAEDDALHQEHRQPKLFQQQPQFLQQPMMPEKFAGFQAPQSLAINATTVLLVRISSFLSAPSILLPAICAAYLSLRRLWPLN